MPGPGWYFIDGDEEREVLEALRARHLSRYRFDDPDAVSKTMLFEREMGVLLGKGGLAGNVLRIKPPMCITADDVDFALDVLDRAFARVEA